MSRRPLCAEEARRRREALERNGGRILATARELGLSQSAVRSFVLSRGIPYSKQRRPYKVLVAARDHGLEKKCVKCQEWWPLECFSRDESTRGLAFGCRNECNACRQLSRKARRGAIVGG